MADCAHELIEWQQQDEELHRLGWVCRRCCHLEIGEYHHQGRCRRDVCGINPVW
jgi:hypothetical protein